MVRSMTFAVLLLFVSQTPALALEPGRHAAVTANGPWLSFIASLFTLAGRVLEKTPIPNGPPVGAALEVAQVVLKFVDRVIEEKKIPTPPTPPPGSSDPRPPTYDEVFPPTASLSNLLSPSQQFDAFYASTNRFIDTANDLLVADRNGASAVELSDSVRRLQLDLSSVRNDYRDLGFNFVIRPADILEAQADIARDGLPAFEVDYLTRSGFSSSDIQNFTNHMTSTEIRISRDLDVLEIYDGGVQQLTVVPEPASMTLWATIGSSVLLWRQRRKSMKGRS